MWHWDFCHACGTGISASRTAWLTSVSPRDVHSSAFSICVLYRSILAQQREFFEHPIQGPFLSPSSPQPDPSYPTRPDLPRVQFSMVDSVQFRWLTSAQLVCFVVLWCAVLRCVVFCCVLLLCCFVVLLFCCFVVLLCSIMLCCVVSCFTSSSRIAHCSKYKL